VFDPNDTLDDVSALDGAIFAMGSSKSLRRSVDSGATWTVVNSLYFGLSIRAFDSNTIMMAGAGGACPSDSGLNVSLDGGYNVAQCYSPPVKMQSLSAVDQSILWTKAHWGEPNGDRVYRSLDGGATWTSSVPGVRAAGKYALAASSANSAVVVGEGTGDDNIPTIAETVDGGASWQQVFKAGQASSPLEAVSRLGNGWIAVGPGLVVIRYPGSATWTTMAVPGKNLRAVSFYGTAAGWAVGDNGLIVKF